MDAKVLIGVRVPPDMDIWLTKSAREMTITKSQLIRNLLSRQMKLIKKSRMDEDRR